MFSGRLLPSEIFCHVVTVLMKEAARSTETMELKFTEQKIVPFQRPKRYLSKINLSCVIFYVLRTITVLASYYNLDVK